MIKDLVQMQESRRAFGEQGKVRLLEKVFVGDTEHKLLHISKMM